MQFSAVFDGLFEKFIPGWKVRLAAIALILLGTDPAHPGILDLFGVIVPSSVYATMYGLGLLGAGEKVNALVKSNALMAALEKASAPVKTIAAIEEAKPGSTQLPGGEAMADATTKGGVKS